MAAFAEIRDRHAAGPVVIVATGTLAGDCGRVAGIARSAGWGSISTAAR